MNTSFELWSISQSLKCHGKSKQTQAVEARSKILKTADILLSKTNQESTSVKICDKQDDRFTKKLKRLNIQTDFAKSLVRSYNQLTEEPKSTSHFNL